MGRVRVIGYLSIDRIRASGAASGEMPGGAALYAALGARAAGADVELHAVAGEDYPQAWLAEAARLGIELHVERRAGPTRRARLVHDSAGARSSPHHRDESWWERTDALAPAVPPRTAADVIVLCPMRAATMAAMIDGAAPAGTRVVADTSEAFAAREREALLAQLSRLHVFAPSREETRHLAPGAADDEAARRLAAHGCRVLQKRGAAGAFAVDGEKAVMLPAPDARVVDPNGAGDATVGALAAHLAAGVDFFDAARAAMQIGARTVGGFGPAALGLDGRH